MSSDIKRRAVVFAYHNVGVRCLRVLAARGIQVELVVTHEDNATENIWFGSVRATAQELGIPYITPDNANGEDLHARIAAIAPDFIFSFYYRHMIPMRLLSLAKFGAFNMHGSLLPKYRGRVPINWAVLHGETETGATLHEMVEKPDAGYIVDQTIVPILPDDTSHEVFEYIGRIYQQVRERPRYLVQGVLEETSHLHEAGAADLKTGSQRGVA